MSLAIALRRPFWMIPWFGPKRPAPALFSLSGMAPLLLALGAGAAGVGGFLPWNQPWLLILALAVLFRLAVEAPPGRAALLGFVFGLGHFTAGFAWLLTSLHTHGHLALPVAVALLLLLAAYCALFPALSAWVLSWMAPSPGLLPWAAPALWVLSEWLRATLFSGFAWNLAGYALSFRDPLAQVADWGGIYLLSWLAALPAAVLAGLFRPGLRPARAVGLLLPLAALLAAHLYGDARWRDLERRPPGAPLAVGVVQASIPQQTKWTPSGRKASVRQHVRLTREIPGPLDLVVWPETAIPFFFQLDDDARAVLDALSGEVGAPLLTGVPTLEARDGLELEQSAALDAFNSVVLIQHNQDEWPRYDKVHLVPFGEFIPFRDWIPPLFDAFVQGTGDFTPGEAPETLSWDKGDIGPLICYEALLTDLVGALADQGAEWLVNVTNDGWFAEEAKYQHLAMARLRALEYRLPLIRVANTGITAAYDQLGRQVAMIPSNQRRGMRIEIHRGSGESPYRERGGASFWLGCFAVMVEVSWLAAAWGRRRR
ncbi:MAG: apolipoprotein N-acyltransferase [Magnetococcales bacterium]|nr:apolipoprotein N-acyltransferase [Magnetococcales bacterium]